jgi:predicted signal transduction protein with EAL and GGDEF domain
LVSRRMRAVVSAASASAARRGGDDMGLSFPKPKAYGL